jgi:hypothetical protein
MKTFDFGLYLVSYNLVIGILLMIASEKLGVFAGYFMGSQREKVNRLTRIGVLTFGSCVAVISAFILTAGYLLKLL